MTRLRIVGTIGLSGAFAAAACQTCPDDAIYQGDRLLAPVSNCLTQVRRYASGPHRWGIDWKKVTGNITIRNHSGSLDVAMGTLDMTRTAFLYGSILATEEKVAFERLAQMQP